MDVQQLMKMFLSNDSVTGIAQTTGTSNNDVMKVLAQSLPVLLNGANNQAKNTDTVKGFTQALSDHAKADTSNLSNFLSGIDLEDGAKIIGHLLGSDTTSTTKSIAKSTGVSQKNTANILAAQAPLLMSLLGQQTQQTSNNNSLVTELIGTVLEQVDVGSILTDLLTDNSSTKKKTTKKTTTKSTTKKTTTKKTTTKKTVKKAASTTSTKKKSSDNDDLLGDILGSVVKGLLK